MNLETPKQLLKLSRKEPNARKRMRLLAVSLFFAGESQINKCTDGYNDIVDSCSRACNDFISDTKRVVKMCTRDGIEMT